MKNHQLLVAVLLMTGATVFIYSCKNDDENKLLGSWKVATAIFNPPVDTQGVVISDAYPILFPKMCDKDDLFIFEDKGVFKDDEGATKCDPLDPQYVQGKYSQSGATVTITTIKTTVPKDTSVTIFNNSVITDSIFTGTVVYTFGTVAAAIDFTLIRQ